jgi:3-hydroxybutyryl-CoA dehydrogenase
MGLLEFIDYGGGDILFYASRSLAEAMQDKRFAAPDIVERNMREGRVGLRTGRGFYDFSGVNVAAYRKEVLRRLVGQLRHADLLLPPGAAARRRDAS